jgi:hypothetical protein
MSYFKMSAVGPVARYENVGLLSFVRERLRSTYHCYLNVRHVRFRNLILICSVFNKIESISFRSYRTLNCKRSVSR